MIKLSDVAAKEIYSLFKTDFVKEIIKGKDIVSVDDVIALMEEYPEADWASISQDVEKIKRQVTAFNDKGYEPKVFFTSSYSDSSLNNTDRLNFGDVLLLNNIFNPRTGKNLSVTSKSIADIKGELSHTSPIGENYFKRNNRNFGEGRLYQMLDAIEFYQQQVERQAALTPDRDINLFLLDQNKKRQIVTESFSEIVEYLVDNTEEKLVWGNLSDCQKQLLTSSVVNSYQSDLRIRESLVTNIANYTTLPELECVASHDAKVLSRFIVR